MIAMKNLRLLFAGWLALALPAAQAFDWMPDGVSAQVGAGGRGTNMAGAGIVWDWDFQRLRRKAELTAHTEFMVNHWRGDASSGGGTDSLTQLVLLPSLRIRLSRGASPWFIELGIGASWMDERFETPRKRFGSRWNFYDMMGVGHTFGAEHEHELSLRWIHVSNAGLKKPNPGQDFLQLRYVARF
ncbi:MAG TPA: acyloxyacyl hydrolase [Ramlibacter sp.]|nr:acyloxyacyl hydrolase [Ramlibacter sp.]